MWGKISGHDYATLLYDWEISSVSSAGEGTVALYWMMMMMIIRFQEKDAITTSRTTL